MIVIVLERHRKRNIQACATVVAYGWEGRTLCAELR